MNDTPSRTRPTNALRLIPGDMPPEAPAPPALQLRLDEAPNHRHPLARAREALAAVRAEGLGLEAQAVYTHLAHLTDRHGFARASAATIADDLGAQATNVARAIRALIRKDLVEAVCEVAGELVIGGPPHRRVGYRLAAMVAPVKAT